MASTEKTQLKFEQAIFFSFRHRPNKNDVPFSLFDPPRKGNPSKPASQDVGTPPLSRPPSPRSSADSSAPRGRAWCGERTFQPGSTWLEAKAVKNLTRGGRKPPEIRGAMGHSQNCHVREDPRSTGRKKHHALQNHEQSLTAFHLTEGVP